MQLPQRFNASCSAVAALRTFVVDCRFNRGFGNRGARLCVSPGTMKHHGVPAYVLCNCMWCYGALRGCLVHVDIIAHNKSGIAHQDRDRRLETVVITREPHKQPRLLQDSTICTPGAGKPCQQHPVHLSLNQNASKVQNTGVGSYVTQSHAVGQA
jgi:hypothetical protein